MKYKLLRSLVLVIVISVVSFNTDAQQKSNSSEYFTIENYYKVKWGSAGEFIDLWKKNHYPLLKKAIEKGDIISVTAQAPMLHSGEDTRWDFRVTIVFKNAALAFAADLLDPYKKQLYPDQEKLKKDEQHRFELLISHWDVMIEQLIINN
ncbi:EthD domain-containing protein [Pinibacter aurantiacus]|uniref:EthD domain-containing protein n=1 Tax=Pinibacter aurantiacus TaxID=2851599 RepID=A0A9E2SBB9_9BACT|nr:EthD domain-containing protein [Pinibacter aurantiacus]MBV4356740.1 EthD domain-containing protein [Pinibacter aurantiacus]